MRAKPSAPRLRGDRFRSPLVRSKLKIPYPQRILSMVWEAGSPGTGSDYLAESTTRYVSLRHCTGESAVQRSPSQVFSVGIAAWNLATTIVMVRRAPFALRMVAIQLSAGGLQGFIILLVGIVLLRSSPRFAGLASAGDRRRRRFLRRLRHLAPILPGVEASEDYVRPEFVSFATLLRELKARHAPADRLFCRQRSS